MAIPSAVKEILSRDPPQVQIALVGAHNDRERFGNIIFRDLARKGFSVVPVNTKETVVEGVPVVSTVSQMADPVHIVNFVVPPPITKKVLESMDPLRFPIIWLQPGTFDEATVRYAKERFKTVIAGPCIMVETR